MNEPTHTPQPRKWVYAIWIAAAAAVAVILIVYPILDLSRDWLVISLVVLPFAVAIVVILPLILIFLLERKEPNFGARLFDWQTWMFRPKFASLEADLPENALKARGLVVRNIIQSPGWIVLNDGVLTFHPVLGRSTEVPIDAIQSIEESAWFNGSLMPGQTGFMLRVEGYTRLGFAIYGDPTPWREALIDSRAAS